MKTVALDWVTYEREVVAELRAKYPRAGVSHNVRLVGNLSGRSRQIDVVLTEEVAEGKTMTTIVDAKSHSRKVDVKTVESFLGLLADVGASRGILICPNGYTRGALERAFRDDVDLDLDILTLAELREWQAFAAIPFAGKYGVVLPTPLGWVVDGQRRSGALACLYRRGLTLEDCGHEKEWMYVNVWHRKSPVSSAAALVRHQNAGLRKDFPNATISVRRVPELRPRYVLLRRADIGSYPSLEITGFVQFSRFIFLAVLFTRPETERLNTRKLLRLLSEVQPVSVRAG